jgi:galactitol-specific phosphotransferase system IIC component
MSFAVLTSGETGANSLTDINANFALAAYRALNVTSVASSATPTINTDTYDCISITALAAAITSFTTNLSGTPSNFQRLLVRIKDDGTGRAITWGASFEAKGVSLPTTTVANKVLTVGFLYDSVAAKWGCIAAINEV